MTREKWQEVVETTLEEFAEKAGTAEGPEDWPQVKAATLEWIKNIDEVTEVYNMEDAKKDQK